MSSLRRFAGPPDCGRRWSDLWRQRWPEAQMLLLLAATDTAAIEGISAAGATAASRRQTAAADAELLLLGPRGCRPHALPPLPAGVSPALISHVVARELLLNPLVVDLGCPTAPAVPHLRLPPPATGAARCLSGGAALTPDQVTALLGWGARWAAALRQPLLLAECVPGGTSTALAVLTGLGVDADGLVSGSLRRPVHGRKRSLVRKGLGAAGLEGDHRSPGAAPVDPRRVLAAVGDPMQVLAAALVAGAAGRGLPVLLAGGSQMGAVLALGLALTPPEGRARLASAAAVVTTAWVAGEADSDLALLLERVGARYGVQPLAFAAGLRFADARHSALLDYERGFVKEGVGAGGLAFLWELSGRSTADLVRACDQACDQLLGQEGGP